MKLKLIVIVGGALAALAMAVGPMPGEIDRPLNEPATPTTTPPSATRPAAETAESERSEPRRRAGAGERGGAGHEGARLPVARRKSTAAGEPKRISREFALAWVNRPGDGRELARQNRRLVSLSQGFWADRIAATLKARTGSGSRGTVVAVKLLRQRPGSATTLVTTREQLAPDGEPLAPYHFGLYLARLERVSRGFAVSSWEPQF